jgi:hypothetical protein
MDSDELQKHILATYLSLRFGIATVGIVLPLVLGVGGALYAGLPLKNSMSAYYHATGIDGRSMRDWFVGLLFVVGVFLYLYKGYSRAENYLLNVAGAFCIGIAVFPMAWPESAGSSWISLHGFCAITFFLCIAAVAIFCAGDTLPLLKDVDVRDRLKHSYRLIGILMVLSMLAAYLLSTVLHYATRTFYVEACGIFSFAAYWWLKSWELGRTEAEAKALQKRLKKTAGKVRDVIEPAT